MSAPAPSTNWMRWTVKQVLSGDTVVLHDSPKGGYPATQQITLSGVSAPKLARPARGGNNPAPATVDESHAWEAREFLRKKLVGELVFFKIDKSMSEDRRYGTIILGKDPTNGENIAHTMLTNGWVSVYGENKKELQELEEAAKLAKRGRWDGTQRVRDMKWTVDNLANFVEKLDRKRIPAIIEFVKDGSTVRALLLPDFYTVTVMLTGIRCPPIRGDAQGKPQTPETALAEEARFFVEKRLLQREVEIILESNMDNAFLGTVLHPKGNIAEVLLRDGFAQCLDWTITSLTSGGDLYRAAEKQAQEKRLRRWKDYQPKPQLTGKEKEFHGTVVEVIGGDALMVKVGNNPPKKIFLASIRPPKDPAKSDENKAPEGGSAPPKNKVTRPLYDIPWMFAAREFLRKKLIGKKVKVVVDYKQPAVDNFPEKTCCTVTIGDVNVAEAMISKGLGKVVRYKHNDDQRSSAYQKLVEAELKAIKSQKGVFAKETPQLRVTDVSGDATRARQFLSSLQRSGRVEAVVEFVTSGSRLRLYIPKDQGLITFLLAGINCPRGARPATANQPAAPGEPYGEEALQFTKDLCMQREVEIHVENIDKVRGNFIGWLWVKDVNLSVDLVANGLASVHFSAEKSEHFKALKEAEDSAKSKREKIWKDFVPEAPKEEKTEEEGTAERKVDHRTVVVIEGTSDLRFYAQHMDQGPKLDALMAQMRQELKASPPLPGAYTPRRGDICAAKYSDDQWYRAKVEKTSENEVHLFYIDYGNRVTTSALRCAHLPPTFTADRPYAHEFGLAFVKLPKDPEYQEEAIRAFKEDVEEQTFLLNVEYTVEKLPYATLTCAKSSSDVGKCLISDGYLLVDHRKERRLQKLMAEYWSAQDEAKKNHRYIWQYGDITEDDAKEFGR